VDGLVDLVGERLRRRIGMPWRWDGADGPPFDAEAITQFVYGRSGLVTGDEFLDLVGVELSGSTGFGPVSGRWSGRGGVGQLPEQGLQGFYLG
jgi:hypothetical protein